MSPTILVIAEPGPKGVEPVTLEAVTVARAMAGTSSEVIGFVAGATTQDAAAAFAQHGIARVRTAEDARLVSAAPSVVGVLAAEAAKSVSASSIVLGATAFGRALAGRIAARWGASAATGVTEVTTGPDGNLRVKRPVFGGRATEVRRLVGPRTVIGLKPHAFPPAPEGSGTAAPEPMDVAAVPEALWAAERTGVAEVAMGKGPSLGDASIVVSGGRGLRAEENFHLVEELAQSLGAAVGASRAVTDAGWRPNSYQVGQTGRTVSPQLYIAVGISGAIQHLVGMVSSRTIVAINTDATAPIFKVADYGIVGDALTIVPALTRAIRHARGLPAA